MVEGGGPKQRRGRAGELESCRRLQEASRGMALSRTQERKPERGPRVPITALWPLIGTCSLCARYRPSSLASSTGVPQAQSQIGFWPQPTASPFAGSPQWAPVGSSGRAPGGSSACHGGGGGDDGEGSCGGASRLPGPWCGAVQWISSPAGTGQQVLYLLPGTRSARRLCVWVSACSLVSMLPSASTAPGRPDHSSTPVLPLGKITVASRQQSFRL